MIIEGWWKHVDMGFQNGIERCPILLGPYCHVPATMKSHSVAHKALPPSKPRPRGQTWVCHWLTTVRREAMGFSWIDFTINNQTMAGVTETLDWYHGRKASLTSFTGVSLDKSKLGWKYWLVPLAFTCTLCAFSHCISMGELLLLIELFQTGWR